ncbi:epoxide hydrolase family protein [Zavarzinia sp. CC-PAN008]|uniref:epoxide hydrolase family protein n=1 Tax=Zavarzinia sp. CC-PAN008 TaxID=3243332 RepID=UPI003F74494C
MSVKPFRIAVPDAVLERIYAKVVDHRFPDIPTLGDGWEHGMDVAWLRDLCATWLGDFDWRQVEAQLNRWPQFTAEIEGIDVHFVHVKGKGPNPLPLVLTHGWPSTHYEFSRVIDALANPAAHGGDAADAFDVIVPSMPGYGFSGKPTNPIAPRHVARMWHTLMTEQLGYRRFAAQGGDWGSAVTSCLGLDYPQALAGIHITMAGLARRNETPQNDVEAAHAKRAHRVFEDEGAYYRLQRTKPQTLGVALHDNPVGIAAWILEKFRAWSDCKDGDPYSRYTREQLLTTVMIYAVTDTINTANWMYRGLLLQQRDWPLRDPYVTVPTSVAVFPGDIFPFPPRRWVEGCYNVVRWTDMPRGGHFAALEEPELFVEDVRTAFRPLR